MHRTAISEASSRRPTPVRRLTIAAGCVLRSSALCTGQCRFSKAVPDVNPAGLWKAHRGTHRIGAFPSLLPPMSSFPVSGPPLISPPFKRDMLTMYLGLVRPCNDTQQRISTLISSTSPAFSVGSVPDEDRSDFLRLPRQRKTSERKNSIPRQANSGRHWEEALHFFHHHYLVASHLHNL